MADGQARALVGNAADPEQVQAAGRKVKRRAQRRVDLVRRQLETIEGREFVWGEIERHRVHDLISGPTEPVYMFLGKREAGIELLVEVMRDHPALYLQMQKEALERQAQERREIDAMRTPKAEAEA